MIINQSFTNVLFLKFQWSEFYGVQAQMQALGQKIKRITVLLLYFNYPLPLCIICALRVNVI